MLTARVERTPVLSVVLLVSAMLLAGAFTSNQVAWSESEEEHLWVEVIPLRSGEEPVLVQFQNLPSGGLEGLELPAPAHSYLLCRGGAGRPVTCGALVVDESLPGQVWSPGAQVAGAVYQGDRPMPGARIFVVPTGLKTRRQLTLPLYLNPPGDEDARLVRHVESDKGGRFELPGIAPGEYLLEIRMPGGRLFHSQPFEIPEPPPLRPGVAPPTVELGRLGPESGVAVEFLVTDLDGVPLEGALVGGGQGDGLDDWAVFEGKTDAKGEAVVSGFDPTLETRLACRAGGYLDEDRNEEAPPGFVHCQLAPLVTLSGLVVDGEEEPVPDATASVAEALHGSPDRALTGPEGSFELAGLAPGEHTLRVAAPGYRLAEVPVILEAGEGRRELPAVMLEPAGILEGRVLDAETGLPLPGARVEVREPPGFGAAVSGPDGEFILSAAAPKLTLRMAAEGYAEERRTVVPEELTEPLRVELSRGGRIRVRAWDEEVGGPCTGCVISVSPRPRDRPRLLTDGQGEVVTGSLAPGRYSVQRPRTRMKGSVVIVQGGQGIRTVEVQAGETVTVELGERVVVHTLDLEPPPPPGWSLSTESPSRFDSHRDAPTGRVELHRIPGEPLTLTLSRPGFPATWVRLARLEPIDQARRDSLRLPRTRMSGVLVPREEVGAEPRAAAMPARLEWVAVADGETWATMPVPPGGAFSLPHLPPGNYWLRADDQTVHTVSLEARGERDLGEILLP